MSVDERDIDERLAIYSGKNYGEEKLDLVLRDWSVEEEVNREWLWNDLHGRMPDPTVRRRIQVSAAVDAAGAVAAYDYATTEPGTHPMERRAVAVKVPMYSLIERAKFMTIEIIEYAVDEPPDVSFVLESPEYEIYISLECAGC